MLGATTTRAARSLQHATKEEVVVVWGLRFRVWQFIQLR